MKALKNKYKKEGNPKALTTKQRNQELQKEKNSKKE